MRPTAEVQALRPTRTAPSRLGRSAPGGGERGRRTCERRLLRPAEAGPHHRRDRHPRHRPGVVLRAPGADDDRRGVPRHLDGIHPEGIATATIAKKDDAFTVTISGNAAEPEGDRPGAPRRQGSGHHAGRLLADGRRGQRRASSRTRSRLSPATSSMIFSSVDAAHLACDHRDLAARDRTTTRPTRWRRTRRRHVNSRRSQAIERGTGGAPLRAPSRIRPATRGDAPEIVDLLNACDVAEVGEPDSTLEDLENDWSMEGFDLGRRRLGRRGPGRSGRLRLRRRPVPHRRARGRPLGAPGPPRARARRTAARARRAARRAGRAGARLSGPRPGRLLHRPRTGPSATCCAGTATS